MPKMFEKEHLEVSVYIHFVDTLFYDALIIILLGLGLWCLTPLSTIFQLYRQMVSFIDGETGVPLENH